jgi:hypothetical protein
MPFNFVRQGKLLDHCSSESKIWYEEIQQSFVEIVYELKSVIFWEVAS